MVQTKVPYKLPMKNPSPTIKPCPQSHDKGTDLDMKRSRSISSSPNYMKPTRCFEARKEKIEVPKQVSSSGLLKVQPKLLNRSSTATCSSTLKDGKFPPFLDLNSGGTESEGVSAVKVCHYNHCSLNNHKHEPKPPLKSFLRSRRKALREQRIVKKMPLKDETTEDFVEIYVNEEEDKAKGVIEKESDEMVHEVEYDELFDECSSEELEVEHSLYQTGLEIEDGDYEQSEYGSDYTFVRSSRDDDLCLVDEDGVKKDGVGISFMKESIVEEASVFSRDEITDCYVQFSDSESWANDVYEETREDHGCSDEEKPLTLSKNTDEAFEVEDEKIKGSPKIEEQTIYTAKSNEETSIDVIGSSRFTMQAASMDSEETDNPKLSPEEEETRKVNTKKLSPEEETETCKTWIPTIRSRKQGESLEEWKPFNLRGPNYLELEEDEDPEKVDLRHQEMNKRRNAEEWMLDYALRNVVNRLDPGSKRRVSLLVEAFEKVTPP